MVNQSLAEYISNLLRQGYTETQIRQALLQNNYPESMIEAAFRTITSSNEERSVGRAPSQNVVEQLTSYLRTYLAQGYDATLLQQTLLQQGYKPRDVNQALAAATGMNVRVEHHLAGSTVLKLAILLIFLGGFLYGIIYGSTLIHPTRERSSTERRLLDIDLTLDESSVQPGEIVHATTSVTNMGSGRYDVTLNYQLLDSHGRKLWSDSKTKAVATSFDDNERIPIDNGLPDNTYTVMVSAEYGGESPAEATAHIAVQSIRKDSGAENSDEKNKGEEGGGENKEYNGTVVYVLGDEKEDSRAQALAAVKNGEGSKAEQLCKSIANKARHDDCLSAITSYDQKASHCDAIKSQEKRDSCLMSFVINGAYDLCPKLTQQSNKELCENLQHLNSLSTTATESPDLKSPDLNQYAKPVS